MLHCMVGRGAPRVSAAPRQGFLTGFAPPATGTAPVKGATAVMKVVPQLLHREATLILPARGAPAPVRQTRRGKPALAGCKPPRRCISGVPSIDGIDQYWPWMTPSSFNLMY